MYKNVALAPKKRDIFMLRYQNYTGGFKQSNLPTTRLMGDCAIFSPLMRFIDSFLRTWYIRTCYCRLPMQYSSHASCGNSC